MLLLLLMTSTAVEKMRFAAAVDTYEFLAAQGCSGGYFGKKSGVDCARIVAARWFSNAGLVATTRGHHTCGDGRRR